MQSKSVGYELRAYRPLQAPPILASLFLLSAGELQRGRQPLLRQRRSSSSNCLTTVALLILSGTTLGSAAAEIAISPDERDFIAEVTARGPNHARLRNGPFYGELSFIPGHGFWTVDD